jgi:5-methylcytosine-specific restriction endonuclease McrBC GTP-binding regulatory subunit McrB
MLEHTQNKQSRSRVMLFRNVRTSLERFETGRRTARHEQELSLAYSMLGQADDSKVKIIQFHQSYSYEDFVIGYKPNENTFALQEGVFYQFCRQAEKRPSEDFFHY